MAPSALVIISKIRVENLQACNVDYTDLIKVVFRCGNGAADAAPLHPNRDGTAEWTLTLEMPLADTDNVLRAVVSRKSASGNWSLITGGRIEGDMVSTLPARSEWLVPSIAGIRFSASLEILKDEGVQQLEIVPQDVRRTEDGRPPPSVPLDAVELEMNSRLYDDPVSGSSYGAASGSSAGYVDAWGGRDWDQALDVEGGGGVERWPSASVSTDAVTAHPAYATADVGFGTTAPALYGRPHGPVLGHGALPLPNAAPPLARARSTGGFSNSGYLVQGNSQDGDSHVRRWGVRSSSFISRSDRCSTRSFRSEEATEDALRDPESSRPSLPSPEGVFSRSSIYDSEAPLNEAKEDDGYATPEGRFDRSRLLDENHRLDEEQYLRNSNWGGPAFAKESAAPVATLEREKDEQSEEVKAERSRESDSRVAPPLQATDRLIVGKRIERFFKGLPGLRGSRKTQCEKHTASLPSPDETITTGTAGPQPQPQSQPRRRSEQRSSLAMMSMVNESQGRKQRFTRADPRPYTRTPPDENAIPQPMSRRRVTMPRPGAKQFSRRLSAEPAKGESIRRDPGPWPRREIPATRVSRPLPPPRTTPGALPAGEPSPLPTLEGMEGTALRGALPVVPPTAGALEAPSLSGAIATELSWSVEQEEGDVGGVAGHGYVSASALGTSFFSNVGDEAVKQYPPDDAVPLGEPKPAGDSTTGLGEEVYRDEDEESEVPLSAPLPPPPSSDNLQESRYSTMHESDLRTGETHQLQSLLEVKWTGRKSLVGGPGVVEDLWPGLLTPSLSTSIPVNGGAHGYRMRAVLPGSDSSVREAPRVMPAPRRSDPAGVASDDRVLFSCFSPPEVSEGVEFQLRVSAYLRQQRNGVLREARSVGVAEAGVPGSIPIMRGTRVTVKLELPTDVFEVMQSNGPGSTGASRLARPSVQDFEWTGDQAKSDFRVRVRRGALPRSVQCAAKIITGSTVMSLSFHIAVVDPGMVLRETRAEELETNMKQVQTNVARIDYEDLEFEHELGKGVQGTTFAGRWRGNAVAIKRLNEAPTSAPRITGRFDIEHEATILSLLGSQPNIVQFHGLSRSNGGTFSMVTKLEEGGSLEQALRRNGQNGRGSPSGNGRPLSLGMGADSKFSGPVRTAWARDLACGLANSHAFGIVHNDVACRNTLLSKHGTTGRALLCDFGLSSSLRDGRAESTAAYLISANDRAVKWPLKQMPKEALSPPFALSPLSDSYMFGMTLYELYAGEKPFAGVSPTQAVNLVLEGKSLDAPDLLERQGPTLMKVFNSCLSADLAKRPTMEQVVDMLSAYGDDDGSSNW